MNAHSWRQETDSSAEILPGPAAKGQTDPPKGASEPRLQIRIGKTVIPRPAQGEGVVAEIFTMTLGEETIQLVPLKNWSQLDVFKWRARGLLPGTPAGLEITFDHLKVAGETASPWDPKSSVKLEKVFNDWLALARGTLDSAKEKARLPTAQTSSAQPEEDALRFQVELDNRGKARLKCLEGSETVKVVALNLQGLNALIEQGLMRRPGVLKVGALQDWVELDGELFRFQQGTHAVVELEKALNERYLPRAEPGAPPDVEVVASPASPSGFDIQFPATPSGLVENRKRHLNEESIELLADPQRCRVLRKGIIARFTPPNLIFKRKTPDGGEDYLEPGPETVVSITSDDGQIKTIELSQPVSLLNRTARELTAVFNHPAINRRARLAQGAGVAVQTQ